MSQHCVIRHQKQVNLPNVCPPVTLNLRYVRETTNRKPEELAVEGASDRLADGCLADTRRTDKTDDLAFDCTTKLTDGEELKDAVLDVL